MDHLFKATEFFPVSDSTILAHLINTKDIEREMGLGETGSLSIAHGKIAAGVTSKIHVLPCVDQVTYVLKGDLRITMQDQPGSAPYERVFSKGQASMCRAGTALQFANASETDVQVLYIVSPAYIFEREGEDVRFEDAIIAGATFDASFAQRFIEITAQVTEFAVQREQAIARMSA